MDIPMYQTILYFETNPREIKSITRDINDIVKKAKCEIGLCHLFIQHTSASLIICENADPDVRRDLTKFMEDFVPDGDARFRHTAEGADDMPAHIRTIFTETSLIIPIHNNHLALGTWQGVYLWEHRKQNQQRKLIVTITG